MTRTNNRSSDPDISVAAEVSSSQPTALEKSFARSVAIMAQLRAPGGCPWDREQTFDSIRRYTLEETYEVLDAIERNDWDGLKGELGDLLLQVLFYAEMAQEEKLFTLQDVTDNLSEKLIRRHPHVFANREGVETSAQVLQNWEEIKKSERADAVRGQPNSMLDEVPRSLPALMEASKLGTKAASIGFDWSDAAPVFDKLQEELDELRQALASGEKKAQEEELGDVLFTVVNLARKLGVQSEFALRASNAKFRRRFASMESTASEAQSLAELDPEELEQLWSRAKTEERKGIAGE
ncbi:MAG TPA: nucleoside triphosphate pyrophosphohydrolase [Acidobacteriaceae bacterium]|nr:nucleoside triphosphate pyrophosphohydrolase [Acidobacteriaceae bacterium]